MKHKGPADDEAIGCSPQLLILFLFMLFLFSMICSTSALACALTTAPATASHPAPDFAADPATTLALDPNFVRLLLLLLLLFLLLFLPLLLLVFPVFISHHWFPIDTRKSPGQTSASLESKLGSTKNNSIHPIEQREMWIWFLLQLLFLTCFYRVLHILQVTTGYWRLLPFTRGYSNLLLFLLHPILLVYHWCSYWLKGLWSEGIFCPKTKSVWRKNSVCR